MSEVVQESQQEFWRPPVTAHGVAPTSAPMAGVRRVEACGECRTEFMSGSRFCYLCGASRGPATRKLPGWNEHIRFLRILGFQHIKQALGLPMLSLVGFFLGIGCVVAAIAVGRVTAPQSAAEFQGVQFLRIEWLLGSIVAFLAGILLRGTASGK